MCNRPTPDASRREGVPKRFIRLADGADWGFLRPATRLTPKIVREFDRMGRPVERVSVEVGFGYPPQVQSLIGAVKEACEHGSAAKQYEAFFSLATCLLLRAHDVSPSAACELLSVAEGELPRMVREVLSVISETKDTRDVD